MIVPSKKRSIFDPLARRTPRVPRVRRSLPGPRSRIVGGIPSRRRKADDAKFLAYTGVADPIAPTDLHGNAPPLDDCGNPDPIGAIVRPRIRKDCAEAERPCPFVGCKHHLYLDVNPTTGSIQINFPNTELEDMAETCALDVAERGGETLSIVGKLMNVTRERARQIEVRALLKARAIPEFAELIEEEP